ncbi:hypothetical protein SAMN05421820_103762 [Pedobacter steynii]|uniref:Uncharacterized protein n=1 Tax=Pedobacter steynii TaxID=430522 RepID=A0A1G9T0Y2_9SPHI|nr:hypothetical protein [Pedobacter steynii]NQX37269.1 hypothetical protein [Pedobacter steynii]SDM41300.1 hypothetical protein SAMN05421820_103762 [Pedobacter steynii]
MVSEIRLFNSGRPYFIIHEVLVEILTEEGEYPSEEDEDSLKYLVFYLNNKYLVVFTRYHRLLLIERETMRCIGELLTEGCSINAYDKSGKLTTNPAGIFDYEGEILDVKLTKSHELLIRHISGSMKWYELPDWLS